MLKGIDLSFHKGKPDWTQLAPHIDFAILGVTQRWGLDDSFEHNYEGATAHGVKVGAYKYSYAKTKAESKAEAKLLLETLRGRKLDLPIFLDMEWEEQEKLPSDTLYKIIRVFEKAVKAAGYKFGIYCNLNWYRNYIPERLKNRRFWVASYPYADDGTVKESLRPTEVKNLYCWQYSENGKLPGVDGGVDMDIWYGRPKEAAPSEPRRGAGAEAILETARQYLGTMEGSAEHHALVDIYNSRDTLPMGYMVSYDDPWCDVFLSDCFILNDAIDLIGGAECGVERHVQIFKEKGIWIEDGMVTPEPGDIIVFNWDGFFQPNDGWADHIGLVESVDGDTIRTIEGNSGGVVARRTYHVGDGHIRGYARPWYPSDIFQDAHAGKAED